MSEYEVEEIRPEPRHRGLRRVMWTFWTVLLIVGVAYGLDVALSSDRVPRGVQVSGVDVGGMNRADAESKLRATLGERLSTPVQIEAGDYSGTLDPAASGLTLDWSSTLAQAGGQPLNPWTRAQSFFTKREVGVVTRVNDESLRNAVANLQPKVDREPVEGSITFEGPNAVLTEPKAGQKLDAGGAEQALRANWTTRGAVALPTESLDVSTTEAQVRTAFEQVAQPAVAAPVTVPGEGKNGVLQPEDIAEHLSFTPDGSGGLKHNLDTDGLTEILREQLAPTEQPPHEASVVLQGGVPTVQPGKTGRTVDWESTVKPLPELVTAPAPRVLQAVYQEKEPETTTEDAQGFGINEVVSEFTTRNFAEDSGVNIRTVAEKVNGAVVKPGETFSLNGYTGHRGKEQGYIEAGIINNGRPSSGVGGGVSQFATTLYNASYFAGMEDVTHTPHSFYISRYPPGREATVFEGAIDLKFRNSTQHGVLIQTEWTPSSITVRLWSTKTYEVSSTAGQRTDPTQPTVKHIPAGEPCQETSGAPGFSITDTKVVRKAGSGAEVSSRTTETTYNPIPIVKCGGGEPAADAADTAG